MNYKFTFDCLDKEIPKRRKRILELEEKIAIERAEYQKLIYKKAGLEYKLDVIIAQSQKLNVEI